MDVVLIRWPGDERRRRAAATAGQPRLLLVEPDAEPPAVLDVAEDWVRLPASEGDVRARIQTLSHRVGERCGPPPERSSLVPYLDDDGVLAVGAERLPLPPVEARLADALLARAGAVVSRDSLARAGWPDGMPSRNALDVRILRLRRRLEPLGVVVRTVRHRGYLLQVPDLGLRAI